MRLSEITLVKNGIRATTYNDHTTNEGDGLTFTYVNFKISFLGLGGTGLNHVWISQVKVCVIDKLCTLLYFIFTRSQISNKTPIRT